jgi:hypothetical protein
MADWSSQNVEGVITAVGDPEKFGLIGEMSLVPSAPTLRATVNSNSG